MKTLILIKAINVKGHTRSDGTVVQPYTRQGSPSGMSEDAEARTLARHAKVAKVSVESQGSKHRVMAGGKPVSGWLDFAGAKADIMERVYAMDGSKDYARDDAKLRAAHHRAAGKGR